VAAGQTDLSGELSEGTVLLAQAAEHTRSRETKQLIEHARQQLADPDVPESAKHDIALGEELVQAIERDPERHGRVSLDKPLVVEVDRLRARFGSWYEMFPRSWGGLQGVQEQLPKLAELGFDVIYLPPVHPIGLTNRKGRDNALTAGPADPARRGRSATAAAATTRFTPSWAPWRTWQPSPRRRASWTSTSPWTSRSSARPTIRG
jgi:Domain of unknown function (DUF3416).